MTIEILLNKLIEKGRNVFGHKDRINAEKCKYSEGIFYEFENHNMSISLRELVSKESGLRQFCCDNKLVNKYADVSDEEEAYIGKRKSGLDAVDIDGDYIRLDDDYDEYHQDTDYKYWLIECALKDERDLEKFLIDNIKI